MVSTVQAVLVVNPFASRVTEARLAAVVRELSRVVELTVVKTEQPQHATQLVSDASRAGCEAVIVFSGDGGFNEALNGLEGDVPIGFLPGGGTSVLPRALGLPRDALASARAIASALADGRVRRIGLGSVNGRRFCFSAGLGFDGEAVRRLNALGRDPAGARPGDLAFVRTVTRMLLERRGRYAPQLEIDGYGRAAFILVANCDPYSYAGSVALHVAPAATFEEGIDFVAPTRVRPRDVPRLVRYIVRGKGQLEADDVVSGHDLDRIVVRCDRPLALQADGEDLGDVTEATFEARRDAVAVLV